MKFLKLFIENYKYLLNILNKNVLAVSNNKFRIKSIINFNFLKILYILIIVEKWLQALCSVKYYINIEIVIDWRSL